MNKKETKLQIAADAVELLVNQTNSKINELGTEDYILYKNLTLIQTQFDKIRNVPDDKLLEYQAIKKVSLTWKQHVDKIENDYETAAKVNIGGGVAGATLGVGVATLGPTAAMGAATTFGVASTGTAISTLSGAAATNAALAWLGGGTLATGGGGMVAGKFLLALAGPVGWMIAGVAAVGSGLLYWKAKSDKNKLEEIFLLISKRDQTSYRQAIVELNERISRIIDEAKKLETAILEIGSFGTDYNQMTEAQQYTLGSYVNLMNASTQLLVNPILGSQPKFTEDDLKAFIYSHRISAINEHHRNHESLIVYMANLLYKIDTEESDRKLLSKSFRGNKEFLEKMKISKKDIDLELFNIVDKVLDFSYSMSSIKKTV